LGTIELAAVAIENSVIAGMAFGIMVSQKKIFYLFFLSSFFFVDIELNCQLQLGMGSALETLCGQAFGAGQIHMLGVYMQRSWIILFVTALALSLIYIFSPPILKLFGQSDEISDLAGKFAIWMLPQLFAYALNFPIQKFLQSQRKVMAMAWIAAVALVIHIFLSWLFILKLGWGLPGAAITLNLAWVIVDWGS
jgi:MATE family multidrug resistance protein